MKPWLVGGWPFAVLAAHVLVMRWFYIGEPWWLVAPLVVLLGLNSAWLAAPAWKQRRLRPAGLLIGILPTTFYVLTGRNLGTCVELGCLAAGLATAMAVGLMLLTMVGLCIWWAKAEPLGGHVLNLTVAVWCFGSLAVFV